MTHGLWERKKEERWEENRMESDAMQCDGREGKWRRICDSLTNCSHAYNKLTNRAKTFAQPKCPLPIPAHTNVVCKNTPSLPLDGGLIQVALSPTPHILLDEDPPQLKQSNTLRRSAAVSFTSP
ncbi:hypothetical protein EGR_04810 [Echinococcus granulosus]|uniref:Uncharacterized protein n=1 Tax=Echinococcus granulosus TaxID=6210 RepID=W6UPP8_ECHGR|nr:hypothetical protein EGR_04810 [Echinococcus granulosus]EUB60252.1 hypothetical protein EGR_04810 [Echinococcus granulosus]